MAIVLFVCLCDTNLKGMFLSEYVYRNALDDSLFFYYVDHLHIENDQVEYVFN